MKNDTAVQTDKDNTRLTVTRQVDITIQNKINRQAFQQAARLVVLPKIINDLDFVFITLICQANDEEKIEIWEYEGEAYITLTLPYDFVAEHSETVVLQAFLERYKMLVEGVEEIPSVLVL